MKKFTSLLNRTASSSSNVNEDSDSPEAQISRSIRLFCESGGPENAGEEVLHLPSIVDSAEATPTAAKEAVQVIRKFLGKENSQRPYVQYNAIMLTRILTDHPGKTFTRNIDSKYISTVKELLKEGRDMSVQQILRETLDNFQLNKADDETLAPLIAMWSDYKAKMAKKAGFNPAIGGSQPGTADPSQLGPPGMYQQPIMQHQNHHSSRSSRRNHTGLPAPHELASRIEEARTSGKLLTQMVQSTPPQEVLGNELLKEFADRCQAASRSVQSFINADNPSPDEDTLLTLIETNDQLSMALSKHQRSILQARKMFSPSPGAAAAGGDPQNGAFAAPPLSSGVQHSQGPATIVSPLSATNTTNPMNSSSSPYAPPSGPPPSSTAAAADNLENPFDDSNQASHAPAASGVSALRSNGVPGSGSGGQEADGGIKTLSPGEAMHHQQMYAGAGAGGQRHATEEESDEEGEGGEAGRQQEVRRYRF